MAPSASSGRLTCPPPTQALPSAPSPYDSSTPLPTHPIPSPPSSPSSSPTSTLVAPTMTSPSSSPLDNSTLSNADGYLGMFDSLAAPITDNGSIIAIEFDDRMDVGLGDPSHNHVGLDVDSPISKPSIDLTPFDIDLKSGKLITAWSPKPHFAQRLDRVLRQEAPRSSSGHHHRSLQAFRRVHVCRLLRVDRGEHRGPPPRPRGVLVPKRDNRRLENHAAEGKSPFTYHKS
ncbi:putative L-type lectin-domain containing receptor kinase S.7 [Canna indica]|uniref:L-type lectin-domain containing receptor kinase S.7 n=1 Tax=Canna indica TaxID=4628 RepID=A0AAQ3QGJ1_9LILI|nr:putative L-type lectin-domain containing receptor kinase S.7 [Canna indica]